MLDHAMEYPSPTAAAEVVAKRNGLGAETVRCWYLQAQVDAFPDVIPSLGMDWSNVTDLESRRRLI